MSSRYFESCSLCATLKVKILLCLQPLQVQWGTIESSNTRTRKRSRRKLSPDWRRTPIINQNSFRTLENILTEGQDVNSVQFVPEYGEMLVLGQKEESERTLFFF